MAAEANSSGADAERYRRDAEAHSWSLHISDDGRLWSGALRVDGRAYPVRVELPVHFPYDPPRITFNGAIVRPFPRGWSIAYRHLSTIMGAVYFAVADEAFPSNAPQP